MKQYIIYKVGRPVGAKQPGTKRPGEEMDLGRNVPEPVRPKEVGSVSLPLN